MEFTQRVWAQLVLKRELREMYGERFEDFFHRLMERLRPGYSPVRTQGSAGGLSLYDGTLYAFHAPAVPDQGQARSSLRGALRGARTQGGEEIDAFAFVHNDARGAYPEFAAELEAAGEEIQPLELQHRDAAWIVRRFRELDQEAVEELLEQAVPAPWDARRGTGAAELEPLLAGLARRPAAPVPAGARAPDAARAREVSPHKLAYHAFPGELRDTMMVAMRSTHLVDAYFAGSSDAGEHDAVAEGFRHRFRELRETAQDPEDLWLGLEEHVLGGGGPEATPELVGLGGVVITHFFERCDLFDPPPDGWVPRSAVPRPRRAR
ncbi:hypothetical protein [Streptomyces iconiensis]|uniref:Uncharacterized protein n=1 Tax=Streptomyces iconiensis TaxID=1384038 RepID=A0ABT7A043_9ACTN|nr:hypothetical protein [Streptomyces iconiensis]MDJ1134685.1 hypothetical protein [Streptomyces iconiensis]